MKKAIAIILTFALIVGATYAYADIDADFNENSVVLKDYGSCGEVDWVMYYDGILEIRGTGIMDDYKSIKDTPWYEYSDEISKVTVKYGVTNVGALAFEGLNLNTCELSESVNQIGEAAFSNCKNLREIKMPVELESIGRGAFRDCTALSEIHISNGVTELKDNTLYGCKSLQTVYMPKTLTSIGNSVFYGCEGLDTVYYGGAEEDFYNNMEIGVNNMPLLQAYPECNYSEVLPTYTISYYFDNKDTPDETQTKDYNETINITNTIPTKENYTFIGWSTKNNAKSAEYASGSEYKGNVDTVLYAVWEKNLYTVTSSLPSGAYFDNGVSVKKFYLSCNNSEAVIYYTTDGSEPTNQSTLYTESGIVLSGNMILKAVAYVNGELSSNIAEYKYIYDKNLYITEKAAFEPVNIEVGDDLLSVLPKAVKLKTSNNDTVNATITWNTTGCNTDTAGSFIVSGTAAASDSKYIWFDEEYKNVSISVVVSEKAVPPEPDVLFGDINGDGEINMKDSTRLLKYLSNWDVEIIEKGSDLNADGKINMKDATRLLKHLAGWGGELGVK